MDRVFTPVRHVLGIKGMRQRYSLVARDCTPSLLQDANRLTGFYKGSLTVFRRIKLGNY